jgi:hypothetical protein
MYDLEDILNYNMTPLEAKAFKVALLWETLTKQEFPDFSHVRLRKKGDPRKSLLFKYCYKLVRETQGFLEDAEYRLYVLAQLHIFKHTSQDGLHARIDPTILCGDKAWRRWQVWKRVYDRKIKGREGVRDNTILTPRFKIESELKGTKEFFFEKYNRNPSFEQINQAMHDHTMIRWVTISKVTPYYILLSPYVSRSLDGRGLDEVFLFDLDVYRESITPEIENLFRDMYGHEF